MQGRIPRIVATCQPEPFLLAGAEALIARGDVDRATRDLDYVADIAQTVPIGLQPLGRDPGRDLDVVQHEPNHRLLAEAGMHHSRAVRRRVGGQKVLVESIGNRLVELGK